MHEAGVRYRVWAPDIEKVLARRPKVRGAGKLRRVRAAGRHFVDCRWPDHRLTVELDSYTFHSSRYAWEKDFERERAARARGDDFRRYTWSDVTENPSAMLAELRSILPSVLPQGARGTPEQDGR